MRHFGAPGSPVSPRPQVRNISLAAIVDDSQYGFGRAHLADLPVRVSGHLPPFPPVDGFPALRVLRRLRRPAPRGAAGDPTFPGCWTSRARRRCPVRPLEWGHSPSSTAWKVQATTTLPPYRGGPDVRRCVGGCTLASLETGVRTMRSSPYRAGLAGPGRQRLRAAPASTACYGPPWLSPPGKPLAQGSSLPNPSFL
jgi:hypothetical protein